MEDARGEQEAVDALREEARIEALRVLEKLVRKLRDPDPAGGPAAIVLGSLLHSVGEHVRTYRMTVNIGDAIEHSAEMTEIEARLLDLRWPDRTP